MNDQNLFKLALSNLAATMSCALIAVLYILIRQPECSSDQIYETMSTHSGKGGMVVMWLAWSALIALMTGLFLWLQPRQEWVKTTAIAIIGLLSGLLYLWFAYTIVLGWLVSGYCG